MSDKITVYQTCTCNKCRETLSILKDQGVLIDAINYYAIRKRG